MRGEERSLEVVATSCRLSVSGANRRGRVECRDDDVLRARSDRGQRQERAYVVESRGGKREMALGKKDGWGFEDAACKAMPEAEVEGGTVS